MIRSRRDVLAMLGGLPVVSFVLSKFPQFRPPAPAFESEITDYPASLTPPGGTTPGEYRGVFSLEEWRDSHMRFDGTPPGVCSRCGMTEAEIEAEIKAEGTKRPCRGFK
jgi:hypothetical protein